MDFQNSIPITSPEQSSYSISAITEIKAPETKPGDDWSERLGSILNCLSSTKTEQKGKTFELTRRQRREILPHRIPTRAEKLIWSIPLPEGSYPAAGLPIWERLYLDKKLPMLKCPPNALAFARQRIGKKLWKDTQGQEFILYDPHSYEVTFTYENVHDPHLTTYYEGKEIRGFLLRLGDATADGWGLCTLKRFNQYRKYLKRVHLSLVHTKMERQEALKDEIHKLNEYRQTTKDTLNALESLDLMEGIRATNIESLKQTQMNRVTRVLTKIKEKEVRIQKLYQKRELEKEIHRQRGLKLVAEQELKNKIATEIKRRKKIATLRRWHDAEEKTMKILKRLADERIKQRAEKVQLRWQNKIVNLRKMLEKEDEILKLQNVVREENIKIRNALSEKAKQLEKDRFNEIRKEGLRKKMLRRKQKEDKHMEKAIIHAWFALNTQEFDYATEIHRVKKSLNSTMAELLSTQMQGPDRLSIILMCRNRIQREQKIPFQVSFAIDIILETTIEEWAKIRLNFILETVVKYVTANSRKVLLEIKAKNKDRGLQPIRTFKASEPRGIIFQPDPEEKKKPEKVCRRMRKMNKKNAEDTTDAENQLKVSLSELKMEKFNTTKVESRVAPNYVHFGIDSVHEYPMEIEPEYELKSVKTRPKTPMPHQDELCRVGFEEERLNDVLPTLQDDLLHLKEKEKFNKVFKSVAINLYKRSATLITVALEPISRVRSINKLVHLGDTDRTTQTEVLCSLVMNKTEKMMNESDEFQWLTKAIAREAIKEVLNPPELNREEHDKVERTKIMFYIPKEKHKKPV